MTADLLHDLENLPASVAEKDTGLLRVPMDFWAVALVISGTKNRFVGSLGSGFHCFCRLQSRFDRTVIQTIRPDDPDPDVAGTRALPMPSFELDWDPRLQLNGR